MSIDHQTHSVAGDASSLLLTVPFWFGLILYIWAAVRFSHLHKVWPIYRSVLWTAGIACALIAVAGPLAEKAHTDFTAHMAGHLLLGMLAPLLMVVAAPITLLLRTIPVRQARLLTRLLKSRPTRFLTDPVTASILNVGGLWILYTTSLYTLMHESQLFHFLIHVHVFLAGYLFTASIMYIDPVSHRRSFLYRTIVLVFTLAGHGILSKYLYVHPPAGVPAVQAEAGSMLMYYGGDAIDLVLIVVFCFQWYKAARPRTALA
ncbi:cytochrome c oxidase assembly protein [Domibacillus sp. A3M-37]|uniref:cytochrome c oxidase assembly protein n=1 Tax=Domibacillus sp. A3M-37 TaxID=2962037 RepID=UPI0020B749F8|nr:cytochrome c oxidase assembly protein [Domibacillus sp. A3M-37]MCP3763402.1 cytochrome c oxidase assembly protein [Domibacillus sp. A3M-37]